MNDQPAPIVELVGVGKRYDAVQADVATDVLTGVDLTVTAGESLAITGPSGSGKSTLLNIIGTLDHPTTGRAVFDGIDLGTLNDRQLAKLRNRQIGFVFQDHHLLPQCTALENVLIPTLATKDAAARNAAPDTAVRLLRQVGLHDRMHYRPDQLSGGQCQRVAVVRALINRPKLLLADEPTGSLDRANADALAQLLAELNREEKVTLIVVSHSAQLVAHMSRVLELRDGQLVDEGTQA